jgi:hypothetical protein
MSRAIPSVWCRKWYGSGIQNARVQGEAWHHSSAFKPVKARNPAIQRDPIPRELSPEPGKDAGLVRSIRGRNLPKEFPYCPERWVRLSQFRFCKVDLSVIQVSVQILHLGHGIPIFVRLLPAIMAD